MNLFKYFSCNSLSWYTSTVPILYIYEYILILQWYWSNFYNANNTLNVECLISLNFIGGWVDERYLYCGEISTRHEHCPQGPQTRKPFISA